MLKIQLECKILHHSTVLSTALPVISRWSAWSMRIAMDVTMIDACDGRCAHTISLLYFSLQYVSKYSKVPARDGRDATARHPHTTIQVRNNTSVHGSHGCGEVRATVPRVETASMQCAVRVRVASGHCCSSTTDACSASCLPPDASRRLPPQASRAPCGDPCGAATGARAARARISLWCGPGSG